ncbi:MAG: hypothetical protein LBU42_05375, partial [Prevotellaceae bacterium]|jgi:uncharacterized protein (TIGR02145 family)|nr:hypothetical protein [Prevotellaceae bacterium]
VPGTTIATSAVTFTPATITDATGYPGLWCLYTGSDLYMDASHRCMERQSGAGNWEAWIKDSRDDELYRIVKMPDDKWWLAQNVKIARYDGKTIGSAYSGCTKDDCGRWYTHSVICASYAGGTSGTSGDVQGICPPEWLLPKETDFTTLIPKMGNTNTAVSALRPLNATCKPITNTYGWASRASVNDATAYANTNECYLSHPTTLVVMITDYHSSTGNACDRWQLAWQGANAASVRCVRYL